MNKIFISYSRKDEYFARCLAADLEACGAEIWIDVDDIPVGSKWSSAVQEGLRKSEIMLLILSPESMASPHVEDEWNYFHDKKKQIVPLLWRDCEPHFQLWRMSRVEFRREHVEYAAALRALIDVLRTHGMHLTPPPAMFKAITQARPRKSIVPEPPKTLPNKPRQTVLMPTRPVVSSPATAPVNLRGPAWILGGALVLAALILGGALLGAVMLNGKESTPNALAGAVAVAQSDTPQSNFGIGGGQAIPTLRLTFDNELLTLQNVSETSQDIHRLTFEALTGTETRQFKASAWQRGDYQGMGSIYAIPPDGCFQLGVNTSTATDAPRTCDQLHLWSVVYDPSQRFWLSDAGEFAVMVGGRELARCAVETGVCAFTLDAQ